VLGAELLSRDMVAKLSEPINSVTDDFITRLRDVRDTSGDRAVVDQLPSYVYRWTLEGKSILNNTANVLYSEVRHLTSAK